MMEGKLNMSAKDRDWLLQSSFYLLVFVFFWFFFTELHPLVIYDTDDWLFFAAVRKGYPQWSVFNPTRVLPEVMASFFGNLAGYVIYPFTHDLMKAATISFGMAASLFIVFYTFTFNILIRKRMELSVIQTLFISVIFLLTHFIVFRSGVTGNLHLFYCGDVTVLFFYNIPIMLNAALVYLYEAEETYSCHCVNSEFVQNMLMGVRGLLVYLAVCSNLCASSVFVIYASWRVLREAIDCLKCFGISGKVVIEAVKKQWRFSIIILFWFVMLVFELNGGRAGMLTVIRNGSFIDRLAYTVGLLIIGLRKMNKKWVCLTVVIILLGAILLFCHRKKKEAKNILKLSTALIFCGCLQTIYLVLLSCETVPEYLSYRSDILLGIFVFIIPVAIIAMITLTKWWPRTWSAAPMLCFLLLTEILCPWYWYAGGHIFADNTSDGTNVASSTCLAVSNYLIDQIVEADRKHLNAIEIAVPKFPNETNWPLQLVGGYRVSDALYKYNVIESPISVTFVADSSVNARFPGLPQ